jgi:hypothetical protein
MPSISLTGEDVAVVNGRVLHDVADGDWTKIDFDNKIAAVKVSKDGNLIFAQNQMGYLAKIAFRILIGSNDDDFFNSLFNQQTLDFSAVTLLSGSFTKRAGDGQGNVANVIYQFLGGVINQVPNVKSSAEGDTEQSVSVWELVAYLINRANQ